MTAITQLGTILSIWAHPDDESWTAGGILMTARQNGQRVACVTATRGEDGVQDESRWPKAQLGAIRERELRECLRIMDITEHYWLTCKDGECATTQSPVAKLTAIINEIKPDTILTFGPDGYTGHPDHAAISRWTDAAVQQAVVKPVIYHAVVCQEWYAKTGKAWGEKFNVFFNIDKPVCMPCKDIDINLTLTGNVLERKAQALRAQESQTSIMFSQLSEAELTAITSHETFVRTQ